MITSLPWTALASIVKSISAFLQIIILTRLLPIEQVALFGLAAATFSTLQVFNDFGISYAIVNEKDLNESKFFGIYIVNLIIGILVCLFLNFLAPLLSTFYNYSALEPILKLLSFVFLISSVYQPNRAKLERNFEFKKIARVEILASFISTSVLIVAAFQSQSAIAYVYALILYHIVFGACIVNFDTLNIEGMKRLNFREIFSILSYGLKVVLNNIINVINSNAEIFIIAKIFDPSTFGVFTIFRDFVLKIGLSLNPIVTKVSFPYFSRVAGDRILLTKSFLQFSNYSSLINAPIYVGLAVYAEELSYVMWGAGYNSFHSVLSVLAFWGFFRSVLNNVGSLVFGINKVGLAIFWNVGISLIYLPPLFFISKYGVEVLVVYNLISMIALVICSWFVLLRSSMDTTFLERIRPVIFWLFISLIVGVVVRYFLSFYISGTIRAIIGLSISSGIYFFIFNYFRKLGFFKLEQIV